MKIHLGQQIALEAVRDFRHVYKEFEFNFIPRIGENVSDTAFKDPYSYPVADVNYNFDENVVYVTLNMIVIPSSDKKLLKSYIDMYKLHNWKCDYDVDID
ncbi:MULTISPECIES: hypothetical protein [Paenibacillus]|uniref:hypothetical protein n=1 Tax=Paenibacillus TaxID=44249 RepID=UPI0003901D62|nr:MULTISPECIES: hypothetical protein [Paenibacillus]CDN42190.1 Uncharacterized protein BN871_AY_00330 [Paenibacillus sp. P22]